ncbi:OsmC family protein [Methylobacterium oryzihabitans]|uniref:OsmC family peroxiredoxin n=1 Tax=Methylobacterium oryzihabitans TaxID=2499852 RepID=A0A3S2V678_9HYPH|nr:OsmC family protein [Methylobacterium oryzihabitans]RVU16575.1 OsmC family peroxiredoxin [Methylobacterium oryzihabitans]
MADRRHGYRVTVTWTGNRGEGTASYRGYGRDHRISVPGKPDIPGSSDPSFRGDADRWNPEELLLASLSACHKLWYLGLCAEAGLVVVSYEDEAEGTMVEEPGGAGQFTGVVLRPRVVVAAGSDRDRAEALHRQAHAMCFIARSVNFPVEHRATITVAATAPVAPA